MKINMEKSKKIDILELIKSISSSWLTLTMAMIAGGLAGVLFGYIQPPVYESNASFGVTIDYTQTGALSDVQEDQAMRGVGYVLLSDALIEETVSRINSEGIYTVGEDEFRDNAFVDRGDFRWIIRYRDRDPQRAFQIVSAWAEAAWESYEAALTHAQAAESYLGVLNNLQSCYQQSAPQVSGSYCGFAAPDDVLREITQLSGKIQSEKTTSQGIFYALSIVMVEDAKVTDDPVRYQTNLLVIAGAIAGLLIGTAYFGFRYTRGGRAT
jgi:hypothetical protein